MDYVNIQWSVQVLVDMCCGRLPPNRWVVAANGSITVRLRFMAVEPGEYDDILHLKIAWTQTTYQLHCRCLACFPAIAHEPRYADISHSQHLQTIAT